ncbi:MFS transporter [Spongiibacter sp. KMU-158]|uniref:MFS transporter n=1 Tax=Spongiibacter pelagi TaxID=2760804 RepID=A0A927GWT8_9GAMM|nr:MFS transporter [Spongiibacter pelagi]MBD2859458.1 MFS transporter [Spongiibacter pelagi]
MAASPSTDSQEILHPNSLTPMQWLILTLGMLASMIEGFDIVVIAYASPAISADWGIPAEKMGLVLSAGVFGMTLGAMFLSWIADRYGRRIAVSGSLIMAGLMTSAIMLCSNAVELMILRAVAGLALGLLVASLTPLMGEFSPAKHRVLIISIMVAGASLGAVIGGMLTGALIESLGWKPIFLYAGLLTVVVGVLSQIFVPESIAFTLKRHPATALEKVNRILGFIGQPQVNELPFVSQSETEEKATVNSLLTPNRRNTTLLTWAAFFTGFVVVYFISSWMPQVLSNAGLSQQKAIQGTAAIPFGSIIGTMLMGYLAKKIALNKLIAGGFVLGTICIFIVGGMTSVINSIPYFAIWIMLFLIGITLMGAFSNLYNIALAVYPAQIRSTGLGWAAGLGRAGAVISPLLAGVLMGFGLSIPVLFILFAIPALAAALCTWKVSPQEMQ